MEANKHLDILGVQCCSDEKNMVNYSFNQEQLTMEIQV